MKATFWILFVIAATVIAFIIGWLITIAAQNITIRIVLLIILFIMYCIWIVYRMSKTHDQTKQIPPGMVVYGYDSKKRLKWKEVKENEIDRHC